MRVCVCIRESGFCYFVSEYVCTHHRLLLTLSSCNHTRTPLSLFIINIIAVYLPPPSSELMLHIV